MGIAPFQPLARSSSQMGLQSPLLSPLGGRSSSSSSFLKGGDSSDNNEGFRLPLASPLSGLLSTQRSSWDGFSNVYKKDEDFDEEEVFVMFDRFYTAG
jgi:hypothetical protein